MSIKTTLDMVTSHWCQPIGGLHVTPSEFYESVINAIHERKIPGVSFSRVFWKETTFVGANREYLRVQRGLFIFDICAAPYGAGSFISSWLCIVPFRISAWHLAGIFASVVLLCWLPPIAAIFVIMLFLTGTAWWLYHRVAMTVSVKDDFLLGMTGAGPFLKAVAEAKPTYFQIDSAAVFQTVVQEAVMGVIDGLCTQQNIRSLTEFERKPAALEFKKR